MTVKIPGLEEKLAIARLKQGDLNGMQALVKRYQVRAVSAAFLIVRDPKLAEDIVQDAFLRVAEKIDQFDENRPFEPWFLRSVVNASIKAVRRQKRFVQLDGADDEEISKVAQWLIDPDPHPELLVETQETRQMVWKALGELAAEQRAVIIMRHFLEMSEAEMTEELDRPLTTIRWRLKAARNQLRKILRHFWKSDYQEARDEG
ncbi:MAG TPA: sigma-70 family RNA polymerase sigma factor [Anaerolineales bacterium]|nr:sigma-70 family RNA polymerase sigma factor [Anaerolineales bacterium]